MNLNQIKSVEFISPISAHTWKSVWHSFGVHPVRRISVSDLWRVSQGSGPVYDIADLAPSLHEAFTGGARVIGLEVSLNFTVAKLLDASLLSFKMPGFKKTGVPSSKIMRCFECRKRLTKMMRPPSICVPSGTVGLDPCRLTPSCRWSDRWLQRAKKTAKADSNSRPWVPRCWP